MAAVAVGLLLALAVIWVFQRRLIYFPSAAVVPTAASVLASALERVIVKKEELHLGAWFVAAFGRSGGTVLVFNGNAGDRSSRAPLAAELASAGLGP